MSPKQDIRLIALGFFVLAVAARLVPHAYNVSAIGALGMFLGCYWSARMGFLIAILAMATSEMLGEWLGIPSMGFYAPWLMLTVYFAIACSAIIGKHIVGWKTSSNKLAIPLWAGVPLGAFVSAVVFFLITNFASWLDPQMMYPRNAAGLIECYWAALPFAKNTLIGNLAFSALFFGCYAVLASPQLSRADVR